MSVCILTHGVSVSNDSWVDTNIRSFKMHRVKNTR